MLRDSSVIDECPIERGVFSSRACPNPFPDVRLPKKRYCSSPSTDFNRTILLLLCVIVIILSGRRRLFSLLK